ncbi:hypothetical protein [Cellulomonas xylanilytica]|uniref:Uncharacterized protein n=1 Tax=Cellulomonas xylanilytica TaxID=233583 RepID=A0A510UZB9_9CELL|nr:hypothetical protein [Cellulomonas xylanilytica]GEK20023.1 hypothetical protein CXY01_05430 [Cellulomonas xylanilytica]
MTEHGWFDEDWDDDGDDVWDVPTTRSEGHGLATDLPRPPGALRSGSDALAVLLDLVGPGRAGGPALWFVLLDSEDRALPVVLPIADVPVRADRTVARRLLGLFDGYLRTEAPGGSVVVGLVRAAGGDLGAFEAQWVPALRDAADDAGVRLWAVVAIGESRARVLEW